jgi:hypothetical protein
MAAASKPFSIFPCVIYREYDNTQHWEMVSWNHFPRFRGLRDIDFATREQAEAKLKRMGLELVKGLEVTEAHQCQLMIDELEGSGEEFGFENYKHKDTKK